LLLKSRFLRDEKLGRCLHLSWQNFFNLLHYLRLLNRDCSLSLGNLNGCFNLLFFNRSNCFFLFNWWLVLNNRLLNRWFGFDRWNNLLFFNLFLFNWSRRRFLCSYWSSSALSRSLIGTSITLLL
jgi:hypothetical protein